MKKNLTLPTAGDKLLSVVPTQFSSEQLLGMLQRTPKQHIYTRPAKGGGTWEFVTGTYVKKVLNYVFGWNWSFEVKEHGREGNQVWVLGKLTVNDPTTHQPLIVKEQFGRADIKLKKNTNDPLDFGNDLKGATTDALKKCASELGIASDIYGKTEFKEISEYDKGFSSPKEGEEESTKKVDELKEMLTGETDEEKIKDFKKRTGINLRSFKITEKHASILIANLLNS